MARNRSPNRCARCRMSEPLCLCSEMPRFELRTRVLLLTHWSELKTSTNTARYVNFCLPNSELLHRGRIERKDSEGIPELHAALDPSYAPILLFPTEDSRLLTRETVEQACAGKPPLLVVPDGNWRQASKIPRREPALQSVPRFHLSPGAPSEFILRREPRPECVCTLEAVARALGVLEGEAVQTALEELLRKMVSRVRWVHGKIGDDEVYGGLPEGAQVFRAVGPEEWRRRYSPKADPLGTG